MNRKECDRSMKKRPPNSEKNTPVKYTLGGNLAFMPRKAWQLGLIWHYSEVERTNTGIASPHNS